MHGSVLTRAKNSRFLYQSCEMGIRRGRKYKCFGLDLSLAGKLRKVGLGGCFFSMKSHFVKTFWSFCLSTLLVYSSIAWAFQECLAGDEGRGVEQVASATGYKLSSLAPSTRAADGSSDSIHCVSTYRSVDAIASAFSIGSLRRFSKDLNSNPLPSSSLAKYGVANPFTGRSPPDWCRSSISSGHLPRHLLFSVFLV